MSVRSAEVERCRFGCSLMMTTSPFRSTWTGVWREVVCVFFGCAEKNLSSGPRNGHDNHNNKNKNKSLKKDQQQQQQQQQQEIIQMFG